MMYVHGVVFQTGTKVVKGEPIYPRFEVPEMVEITAVEEKLQNLLICLIFHL